MNLIEILRRVERMQRRNFRELLNAQTPRDEVYRWAKHDTYNEVITELRRSVGNVDSGCSEVPQQLIDDYKSGFRAFISATLSGNDPAANHYLGFCSGIETALRRLNLIEDSDITRWLLEVQAEYDNQSQ